MSLTRPILNAMLKAFERSYLSWETNPARLRRTFEFKAKLLFPAPKDSRFSKISLEHGGQSIPATQIDREDPARKPLILYFHGGGFVFGSSRSHRSMVARLSKFAHVSAVLPDYRLAPESPFPAAIEDAKTAYQAVMDRPGGVILGGDSAGGGLALSLLGEILQNDWPQPLGVFCFSPLTDATFSGESLRANARSDALLPASRAQHMAQAYLNGADPKLPTASPLYADFEHAPPIWLTVSDQEILLDDTIRMAATLRTQGVQVTEVIETGLPHVWPIFEASLPEGRTTLQAVADWVNSLSTPQGDS